MRKSRKFRFVHKKFFGWFGKYADFNEIRCDIESMHVMPNFVVAYVKPHIYQMR